MEIRSDIQQEINTEAFLKLDLATIIAANAVPSMQQTRCPQNVSDRERWTDAIVCVRTLLHAIASSRAETESSHARLERHKAHAAQGAAAVPGIGLVEVSVSPLPAPPLCRSARPPHGHGISSCP